MHRFPDTNLGLCAVVSLSYDNHIQMPDEDQLDELHGEWEEHEDAEDPGYEVNGLVLRLIQGITVTPEALHKLEDLSWEAGNPMTVALVPECDGSEEIFDITSLAGIEVCSNLEKIYLEMSRVDDLSPLRALPKLVSLDIEGRSIKSVEGLRGHPAIESICLDRHPIDDLSALLSLPSLKRVSLEKRGLDVASTDEQDRVLQALRDRGVEVSV